MRIFKSKWFNKWAEKEGLTDKTLIGAITEMEDGLNDGDLGGHVYKKRAAIQGQGNVEVYARLLPLRLVINPFSCLVLRKTNKITSIKKS